MLKSRLLSLSLLATLIAMPAFAQTGTPSAPPVADTNNSDLNRDVYQQNRIEQGLKSGQLSTGEAAQLENGEKRIDNAEARALKNGDTPAEQAHIQQMENAESTKIYDDKHNSVTGNPNSASSERMQNDVQRNANQEKRIDNGVKNGSLTDREAGQLEHGQAKVDRAEYKAGKNGHVSAREQAGIQGKENHQSKRIYRKKHNDTTTTPPATTN